LNKGLEVYQNLGFIYTTTMSFSTTKNNLAMGLPTCVKLLNIWPSHFTQLKNTLFVVLIG